MFELPDDEQPPPEIWHEEEALKQWFEDVESNRKNRSRPGGDQVQTVPMDDNERCTHPV